MGKIPKPVTAKKGAENFDDKHLQEWKELFKGIDQNISVLLKGDENFYETHNELCGHYDLDSQTIEFVIIVILPGMFGGLEFLIGMNYNKMFSHQDILNDTLPLEIDVSYEPDINTWAYHYKELVKIREREKNKVKKIRKNMKK